MMEGMSDAVTAVCEIAGVHPPITDMAQVRSGFVGNSDE